MGEQDSHRAYTIAMRFPTPRDESIEWRCAGEDPQIFQPQDDETLARAQSICAGCPARFLCLNLGLQRREWGVWGGVLLEEGKRLAKPRRTRAGWGMGERTVARKALAMD